MDRKLILFVEDSVDDREIYGKLLWYNGFDMVFAETVAAAVSLLRQHVFDLAVIDINLPDSTGFDLCASIRSNPRTESLPIIILTAHSRSEFGATADDLGCAGFLEKPVAPLELLHEVERLIGRAPVPGDLPSGQDAELVHSGSTPRAGVPNLW
jgi:CheY-like chemotaxis protein